MKRLFFTLLISTTVLVSLNAQKITGRQKIKEAEVPKAVKEAYANSIGFPVDEWVKLTIADQPRYVAVFQQMNSSSGKTLSHRYRYNEQGKLTSGSEYRGDGKGEEKDFFADYLGIDADESFVIKIGKLLKENTLLSFEGFDFVPGNQPEKFIQRTHRFILKDKKGQRVILYFDGEGKELDISKYPLRKAEAEEID